jgi:ABC-type lipoprotein release transport system permease subunit
MTMTLSRLILREILYRKLNLVLALLSVMVAVGCLVAELTVLRGHDIRTAARMAKLEDEMRRQMKKLGFNIVILPKDQNLENFYAEDYASKSMPEDFATKLANSRIVTVRHLLPGLRQKVEWKEHQGRMVILIGVRGEVPLMHRDPKKPILYPVPPGTMVVGYQHHKNLKLHEGYTAKLLGKEFTVHKCHPQRGTKDDITIWINLEEAQQLLGREGRINEILALKCHCEGIDIGEVREEIERILPETQVIELGTKAFARAKARDAAAAAARDTRRAMGEFAAWLVPLVTVACTVWIGFLAFSNVRERLPEIGILRALGLRSAQVFFLFLGKAILIGLVGAALGHLAGFVVGMLWSRLPEQALGAAKLFDVPLLIAVLVLAPLLSGLASLLPAMVAAQQDPALVLREG